jgi:hypothetical protein
MNNKYSLSGGVEKHHDGSFTIYGSYYHKAIGSEVLYHKRFYQYDIRQARQIAKNDLINLTK